MRWNIGLTVGLFLVAASATLPARAQNATQNVADNSACATETERQEKLQGVPEHLLNAISLVESGRWDAERKVDFAWPWTVTAEGEGHFLPSKEAAIALVRQLQGRGVSSIDVGCMQVNLQYHPDAFANLDQAFDPAANVAYATRFLIGLEQSTGNWPTAAGYYHSQTPPLAAAYRAKVQDAWNNISSGNAGFRLASLGDAGNAPPVGLLYLAGMTPSYDPQASARDLSEKSAAALARTEAERTEAKRIADAWRQARLVEWELRKQQAPGKTG